MISAGATTADNTPINSEYWYDLFLMYNTLIEGGYSHDDIFVLYGFGSDFVSSLERYQNPYPQPITDSDNRKQSIQNILGMLGAQMTEDDQVYVWWLGHGSGGGNQVTMYIENYGETVTDAEFAGYMTQIPNYRLRMFSFMTCHSGGIIDDLENQTSIVMTSSTGDQTSASDYLCDTYHSEFHYFETCAFDWDTPFSMCGPVDADSDDNLMVSFLEAFLHAEAGTQMSWPQLSDEGGHSPSSYLTVNGTPGGLIFHSHQVSDDETGGSIGNGDGVLNPGETIELWVTLYNSGTETAHNITGTLASESGNVTVLNPSTAWNDIPPGGEGANLTALVFEISAAAADGEALPFTLTVTDDSGVGELVLDFTVAAPKLAHYFNRLVDTVTGNGNGVLDLGETVQLYVSIANAGGARADGVLTRLTSMNPYVTIIEGQAGTDSIPAGGCAELTPAYQVHVADGAPEDAVLGLGLGITAEGGYQAGSGFKVKVGTCFFDDAEADGAWSLAAPDDDAGTGQWTRVDPIGTWQSDQPVQPEDDHTAAPWTDCYVTGQGSVGGSVGDADVDGGKTTLTTPSFDLTTLIDPRLTYWRWYTNHLGNNPNNDWWVVQISPDGGDSWVDLERTTESANSWQEKTFLVTDYITPSGQVVIRFIASDEGTGSLVEAAIDDFEISGGTGSAGVTSGVQPLVLWLARAQPNPLRRGTVINFTLPTSGEVVLSLYGVDGRLVRTLAEGRMDAGAHDVGWDGADNSGRRVSPGVYFYRLAAGEKELTHRLVVVR
jgi:hypothetical protein